MKHVIGISVLGLLCLWSYAVQAECTVRAPATYAPGDRIFSDNCSTVDGAKPVTLSTQLAGEDLGATGAGSASGVKVVEQRYLTSGKKTADAPIKASPGYVSHMICIGDASAAAAGTIIIYDSLTETGTAVFTLDATIALDYHLPMVFPINVQMGTGIYLGYATVTDIACTVFYR